MMVRLMVANYNNDLTQMHYMIQHLNPIHHPIALVASVIPVTEGGQFAWVALDSFVQFH